MPSQCWEIIDNTNISFGCHLNELRLPWLPPATYHLVSFMCICDYAIFCDHWLYKQRVLMHGHQGWNVRHGLCHIYMIYVYIWVVYSFCLFCCLFIIVTTQFVALYKPCKPKPKPSTYDPPPPPPPPPTTKIPPEIRVEVNCNYYVHPNFTDIKLFA